MQRFFFYAALLFSLALNGFAQSTELLSQYEASYASISGYRGAINFDRVRQTLELAKRIADAKGIAYEEINLTSRAGESYPAIRFRSNNTTVGKEVLELERKFGGLELILSPYDLSVSQSNAFFKTDGSLIGAPKNIVLDQLSTSYFHEKMHAATYQKLINKTDDTYAGTLRLEKGERMSESNYGGYFRHASLDEFLATEYSVIEETKYLYQIFQTQERQAFNQSRANEEILSGIKFDLENLIGLARQNVDLIKQVKGKLQQGDYASTQVEAKLGENLRSQIYELTFMVNSVERVFVAGRGLNQAIPNGTKVILKSNTLDKRLLMERLNKVQQRSQLVADKYPTALSRIGVRIEYADLPTTDVASLYRAVSP